MICVVLIHSKTGMQSSSEEQIYWVIISVRKHINSGSLCDAVPVISA